GSVTGNRAMALWGALTRLGIGNNGSLNVTNGNLILTTNATASLSAGGTISVQGILGVGANGNTSSGGGQGFLTNNGGFLSTGTLNINNGGSGNQSCLCVINGGTNNLGGVNVLRSGAGSGGFATFGTEGLFINNGLVTMTNLNVGNGNANNWLTMSFAN